MIIFQFAWQGQGALFACPFTTSKAVISGDGQLSLCMGVQSHLALCCKDTLPIMCMGHVWVRTADHTCEGPLVQATRCLTKQPCGVLHLEVSTRSRHGHRNTSSLVDLRCANALVCLPLCAATCMGLHLLCCTHVP